MMRVVRAEWRKLMRPGQLWGSWGTMAGFGALLALLLVATAQEGTQVEQQVGGSPTIPIALLEASDGLVFAFQASGQLLGIVALVVAASNLATEYTSGTLRILFVRKPRRLVVLAGKALALWAFVAVGVLLTLVASALASASIALGRGLDVSSWATADSLAQAASALAGITGTAMVWTMLGLFLATVFRAGFPAIGIGIGFPLVVEGLLVLVLPDLVQWLPGTVLAQLAEGSTTQSLSVPGPALGEGTAIALAVAYGLAFAAASAIILQRRDVA